MSDRGSSIEGAKKMPSAKELVAEFQGGRKFYYEKKSTHSGEGEWNVVEDLKEYAEGRAGALLLRTSDMEEESYTIANARSLAAMQEAAVAEGVPEYIEKVAASKALHSQIEKDIAVPTPEGIKRIFDDRYESAVVAKVMRELTSTADESYPPDRYNNIYGDFQDWAKGEALDGAERNFPGWSSVDFVAMIKLFEGEEPKIRARLEAQFQELGVDAAATRELLKRAAEAKEAMVKAAVRIRNVNGVGLNDR